MKARIPEATPLPWPERIRAAQRLNAAPRLVCFRSLAHLSQRAFDLRFPLTADIHVTACNVRFVPTRDIRPRPSLNFRTDVQERLALPVSRAMFSQPVRGPNSRRKAA